MSWGSIVGTVAGIAGGLLSGDDDGPGSYKTQEHDDRVAFAKAYKSAIGGGANNTDDDVNARQVAKMAIPPGHYTYGPKPPLFTVEQAAAKYPNGVNKDGTPRGNALVPDAVNDVAEKAGDVVKWAVPLAAGIGAGYVGMKLLKRVLR